MSGVRLEVEVHIVTGAATAVQNIIRSVNRAGLAGAGHRARAAGLARRRCCPRTRRSWASLMIDIGGGTTDVALFRDGAVWHTGVMPLGGDHITNDIAVGLRTPTRRRRGAQEAATAARWPRWCARTRRWTCPRWAGASRASSRGRSCPSIIQPRVEEIFTLVARDLGRAGFEDAAAAGVVVTGGTSIMQGVPELAEQIFDLPVRRGVPIGVGGLADVVQSPIYATGGGPGPLRRPRARRRWPPKRTTDRWCSASAGG